MNFKLENFETKKLEKSQLYQLTGGLRSAGTGTHAMNTNTTGDDCDSATADADQDPAVPPK